MITINKLKQLQPNNQLRHIANIFRKEEVFFRETSSLNLKQKQSFLGTLSLEYYNNLLHILSLEERTLDISLWARNNQESTEPVRFYNTLYYQLKKILDDEPTEWDLSVYDRETSLQGLTFPIALFLEDIRSPFNIGAIMRNCAVFGVEKVYLSPHCASCSHSRTIRSAMGSLELVPYQENITLQEVMSLVPDYPVIALETKGEDITKFSFPLTGGLLLIGSEELGLSQEALSLSSSGVVSILTQGAKSSLNVSVATGIALSYWVNQF